MAHVLVFVGDYDLNTKSALREELSRLYFVPDVVLNMSKVRFIDSTFISELVLLVRARREKGLSRVTVVAKANSMVRKVLDVTGIAALFTVVERYPNEAGNSTCVTHADFGRSRETTVVTN